MATAESPPSSSHADQRNQFQAAQRKKLKTSSFDAVTSLFMSLIWFLGVFVAMMAIVWWLSGDGAPPVLDIQIEEAAGRADNPEGFERDFEPPGEEEIEELLEPTLEDTLEAVTDAVSSVAATLTTNDTQAVATTVGSGKGDSRPPGPEGEGVDAVPRGERWQLNFKAKDIKEYARQLDFLKIELGAIGGSIQGVDYAFNLSKNPQTRRQVDTTEEKRLYFMWKRPSPLQKFDRQLLSSAGVSLSGNRLQIRFIPPELEKQLYILEMTYAAKNGRTSVSEIAKTVFQCIPGGGGYEFEVVDQRYRRPKS